MSTFELAVYTIRQGWHISRTFLFAGAFAAACVGGVFAGFLTDPGARALPLLLFGLWAVIFVVKIKSVSQKGVKTRSSARARIDLELGLLLLVATHAIVQMAGGLGSALYPLVFVLIAFLVVYTPQWVGFALVSAAISMEAALAVFGGAMADPLEAFVHSVFIVFFALINLIVTRTEIVRIQKQSVREVEEAKAQLASDARDFRLTTPAHSPSGVLTRAEEEARLSRSSVSEVRRSMYHHVDLLKRTLHLHSCVVLWLDVREEILKVRECVSDNVEKISKRGINRGEGALGAILQTGRPLKLKGLRPGYPGLPYYDDKVQVTDFMGVPIVEGGHLRGVLCADREGDSPFANSEVDTLVASVDSLLRIIVNERVFTQLQKAKSEQGKLLSASERLANVLTVQGTLRAGLEAASQITQFDIAALSLVTGPNSQIIHKATGCRAVELEGMEVSERSSLVAAALKNRHFLPYKGEFDPKQQLLISKKSQRIFSKMRSAMILPLVAGDQPLGTLILAAQTPNAFGEDVRTTLQVMTNQLSAVLQNARMVKRLEEMATTDGLTGLANRRVFMEELEKKLASANRFHKELSIILCDVDKFKSVNDTFGHAMGDLVLQGVAETLRQNVVRDTDLPARFGGEEFVILCEGTATEGAVKLAERIRYGLMEQVFHTVQGELKVTISMGVATFPIHAHSGEDLVARADAALYAAKNGGRNQVQIWRRGMTGHAKRAS